jgi:hypothetical protein
VAYGVSTFYFEEIDKDSTMLNPEPQWKDIFVQNTPGVLHLGYRSGFILGGSTNCPSPFMMAQSVNLAEVSVHNRQLFDRQLLIRFVVCSTGFQAHSVCHCHGLIAENKQFHLEMTTHKIIISPQQVDNNHFIAVCLVHFDLMMMEVSVHNRQLFDRQLLIRFVVCSTGFQAHSVCYCHGLIAENKQ